MFNYLLAAVLELSMFLLVEAAPVSVQSAKPWQAGTGGGIVGFIVLVLDIIAWSKSHLLPSSRLLPSSCHSGCCDSDADVFVLQLRSSRATAPCPTRSFGRLSSSSSLLLACSSTTSSPTGRHTTPTSLFPRKRMHWEHNEALHRTTSTKGRSRHVTTGYSWSLSCVRRAEKEASR